MRSRSSCFCLMVAVVGLLASVPVAASGFPKPITKFSVGPQPAIIGTGDFNGDGRQYLLIVYQDCSVQQNSIVTFPPGRGGGRFGPKTTWNIPYCVELDGSPVFVGDFNGDHKLDIAFEISGLQFNNTSAILVALGKGNGTFGTPSLYNVPSTAGMFGVADVNGDGVLDLVYRYDTNPPYTQFIGVLLGNVDGSFQPLVSTGIETACTLADIKGDGRAELVTATGIRFANPDGTFQTEQAVPGLSSCPAVADFNGDHKLDFASLTTHGVSMMFGKGDGTFQAPIAYNLDQDLTSGLNFAVADFNGDGKPDIFINYALSSVGAILLNDGKGRFPAVANYQFPNLGTPVIADFTGDRRSDVIWVGGGLDPYAWIAPAAADGSLPLAQAFFVRGFNAAPIAAGDFNRDGKPDIAVGTTTWGGTVALVDVLNGKGQGVLGVARAFRTAGSTVHSVQTADLNQDGALDLVVVTDVGFSVLLGTGNGNFLPPKNYSSCALNMAIADFNGDGIPDLAVGCGFSAGEVLLGNGDGTFRTGSNLPANITSLAAADFNHDGKKDLAAGFSGGVGILMGTGDGTFQSVSSQRQGPSGSLVVADFNHDGNLDVAARGVSAGRGMVSVYLGNGEGIGPAKFTPIGPEGASSGAVAVADFNADGNVDLAVISGGSVVLLFGKGTGFFEAPSFYPIPGADGLVAIDLDGNGAPDLAVSTYGNDSVVVLLNTP